MTNLQSFVNQILPQVTDIRDTLQEFGGFMYLVLNDEGNVVVCSSASEALSLSSASLMIALGEEDFEEATLEYHVANAVAYFGWEIMFSEASRIVSSLIGGMLKEMGKEFVKVRPNFINMSFDVVVDDDEEIQPEVLVFDQSIMEQDVVAVLNDMMTCVQDNLSINAIVNAEM